MQSLITNVSNLVKRLTNTKSLTVNKNDYFYVAQEIMAKRIKRILENIKSILRYPAIHAALSKETSLYFFAYSWSFGGGERVFVDMLNLFKEQNPICFVTGTCVTDGFRKEYENAALTVNLSRWSQKKELKRYMLKKMAKAINAQKKPTIVGWASEFMYELIPLLATHVKIIDITHNFTDNGKGLELKTLPYVSRINKRIVVSRGLIKQFENLYKANNISPSYLEKIVFIRNKIPFDHFLPVKADDIQIVFVARNSPEKRSDIVIKIAERCQAENIPVSFKMIGDYSSQKIKAPSNIEMVGAVNDKNIINEYYKSAHILLLTSQRESWGLVIFEAMNFGAVPIATNVGDLSDYISYEKGNGVLIENSEDKELLATLFTSQIKQFYNDSPKLKNFSINAFETIKELAQKEDFNHAYKDVILGELK